VTGDKPSVVPVGTEFLCDQSYPGLTVLGYFHAVPSGLPRAQQSFPSPSKTYFGQVCLRMGAATVAAVTRYLLLTTFPLLASTKAT
jgi:hypothetical protein